MEGQIANIYGDFSAYFNNEYRANSLKSPFLNPGSFMRNLYGMSRKVHSHKKPGWNGREWGFEELADDVGIAVNATLDKDTDQGLLV